MSNPPAINKLDNSTLLEMRLQGMSFEAIGNQYGLSKVAIFKRFEKIKHLADCLDHKTDAFEVIKPQIFTSVERTLLNELVNPDKIQKASLNNVAYAFSQINNANRLARGQANHIVDHDGLSSEIRDLQAAISEYETQTIDITDDATVTDNEPNSDIL